MSIFWVRLGVALVVLLAISTIVLLHFRRSRFPLNHWTSLPGNIRKIQVLNWLFAAISIPLSLSTSNGELSLDGPWLCGVASRVRCVHLRRTGSQGWAYKSLTFVDNTLIRGPVVYVASGMMSITWPLGRSGAPHDCHYQVTAIRRSGTPHDFHSPKGIPDQVPRATVSDWDPAALRPLVGPWSWWRHSRT
jgi:hypothetical protein